MKNYRSALLFTGIVLLLASGAALYHDRILGCIALGISLVLMGGLLLLLLDFRAAALRVYVRYTPAHRSLYDRIVAFRNNY